MIDWYAASSGKNSYFEHDGVHLKPSGAKAYASLLAQALTKQS
jgi:lysophospholipase L1-like esterase